MNEITASAIHPSTTAATKKHSGIGIASFVLGILTVVLFFVLVVIATGSALSQGGQLDPNSMQAIILGLVIVLVGLMSLVGAGLGLASALQQHRRKILGIIGLCLNGLVIALVVVCFILGNMKT